MPSDKFILWIDLETTGNKDSDRILELGAVLTDQTPELNEIASNYWLFPDNLANRKITDFDQPVLAMHANNGLFEELSGIIRARTNDPLNLDHRLNTERVEQDILNWLSQHTSHTHEHIPFAGSGVGHFDRAYIKRELPKLDKRLTYWPLDIGVVRRMTTLVAGLDWDYNFVEKKTHRALDDALFAVDETRAWVNQLRSIPWSSI